MSYKTLIAAVTALALSPAIAFAAPATSKTKPVVTKQVKMEKITTKKQHAVKKALLVHKPAKAKIVTKI